ncbi:uncharacterized protein LOC113765880 [Coffea eugenioides]|uniref:uncharacterized protein LOC113765880 n=1 Tax=Coffea eugenioides TaxID=49369 RepID=UPI000F609DA1|nr:uncharacterized protein LOC113765880 [Coffea eugenioides]
MANNKKLVSSSSGPLLIVPLDKITSQPNCRLGLFSPKDKTAYDLNLVFEESEDVIASEYEDNRIVGCSHGWVMILSKNSEFTLMNVLSRSIIQLPQAKVKPSSHTSSEQLRRTLIDKAILSVDPSHNDNYKVIIIYGLNKKLAFHCCGDKTWTTFGDSQYYHDLVWFSNMLYTLRGGITIEGWDFADSCTPTRKVCVQCSYTPTLSFPSDRCTTQWYLVPLLGEMLFIVRFVGEFVNHEGELLCEGDLLGEEDIHPLTCPYRTFYFQVYKVDVIEKKVEEVRSLKDQVIFLGGNHSFSVSARDYQELKGNSIYFTDDYWDRMFEDYLYGGHDIGVFSLEDKSISPIYECDFVQRFYPTPFWIMPNNCNWS